MNSTRRRRAAPGLCRIGVGDRDLADVVKRRGLADGLDVVGLEHRGAARSASASSCTSQACRSRSGWRSASARSSTSVVWRPAELRLPLAGVHAPVGDAQGLGGVAASSRRMTEPKERRPEALAVLGQGPAASDEPSGRSAPGASTTELVAAHAVCARRGRESPAGAPGGQQRVARRVAERVVVGLEAVEVEQQQQRPARPPASPSWRSGCSARRLGRPVSASLRASWRLARSIALCARNVTTRRPRTIASEPGREGDGERPDAIGMQRAIAQDGDGRRRERDGHRDGHRRLALRRASGGRRLPRRGGDQGPGPATSRCHRARR